MNWACGVLWGHYQFLRFIDCDSSGRTNQCKEEKKEFLEFRQTQVDFLKYNFASLFAACCLWTKYAKYLLHYFLKLDRQNKLSEFLMGMFAIFWHLMDRIIFNLAIFSSNSSSVAGLTKMFDLQWIMKAKYMVFDFSDTELRFFHSNKTNSLLFLLSSAEWMECNLCVTGFCIQSDNLSSFSFEDKSPKWF